MAWRAETRASTAAGGKAAVVEVAVDKLKENTSIRGWYRLFRPTVGQNVDSD